MPFVGYRFNLRLRLESEGLCCASPFSTNDIRLRASYCQAPAISHVSKSPPWGSVPQFPEVLVLSWRGSLKLSARRDILLQGLRAWAEFGVIWQVAVVARIVHFTFFCFSRLLRFVVSLQALPRACDGAEYLTHARPGIIYDAGQLTPCANLEVF